MTDLHYLAVDIFGYTKINQRMHGPVFEFYGSLDPRTRCLHCNTFGPAFADLKDTDICTACGHSRWASQQDRWMEQDEKKDDMQLDPRGTYKSTIVMCRCVQEILCFPDISIAYISAASNLPGAFVNTIEERFELKKGAEPTDFQQLFPEFCFPASKHREGNFVTPMRRTPSPDPTMTATSIESSLSGMHPWKLVLDDLVDNRNTQNTTVIRKINKQVSLLMYLRMRWTYVSYRGTRYSPIDAWGDRLKKTKPGTIKILVRSAWTPKPGKEDIPVEELKEEDVDLLFPEELPFADLKAKLEDDLEIFCAQMLNDPMGAQHGVFDPVKFAACVLPFNELPSGCDKTVIAWRFPYEDGKYYAAGVVGQVDGFRLSIMDVVRGSWKPSRMAFKVVELARMWGVNTLQIEDTPGARHFEEAIKASAVAQAYHLDISWVAFVGDKVERHNRVTRMEPLVNAKRLLFADHISCMSEVRDQIVQFGMTDEREIPEAVSLLVDHLPKIHTLAPAQEVVDEWEILKRLDLHDRLHGTGPYSPPEPEPEKPPPNPYALEDIMPGLNG